MKFLLPFLFLFTTSLFAQKGIQFTEGTWAKLLEKADSENKIIFFDAQTSWCGPCKRMAKEEFPDSLLGAFYNKHFINVTMDMEKGEGPTLSRKYSIMAYPTLLFIDKTGRVVHSAVGYHTAKELIALATEAADPNKRFAAWEDAFRKGNKEEAFLYMFANKLAESNDSLHGLVAEAYLATQKDWRTEKNLNFIWQHTYQPKGKSFEFLLDNKTLFTERQGQEQVFQKIDGLLVNEAYTAATLQTPQQMKPYFVASFGEQAEKISARHTVSYYTIIKNTKQTEQAINDYIKNYKPEDSDEYLRFGVALLGLPKNKKPLKRAIAWMLPIFEKEKKEPNAYILALMYAKSKQKKKALAILQTFLDLNPSAKEKINAKQLLKELEKKI